MTALPCINPGFDRPCEARSTTRVGGCSPSPYDQLNLSLSSDDQASKVLANRKRLASELPSEPGWLQQIHGTQLIHLDDWQPGVEADAAWTDRPRQVAVVLTADCLPILIADSRQGRVAAIHAGWRGLADGIIPTVLDQLDISSDSMAWVGPSIRQPAYEVGAEVVQAFPEHADQFVPNADGRWQASLQGIAVNQLGAAGVGRVIDSGICTYQDEAHYFSHRRSAPCGRQASLIWLE